VKISRRENLARRKRRITRRLRPRTWKAQATPMYRASNIQYEHSDRVRGMGSGGIGAMHRLAQHIGLVDAIDRHVEVMKVALPYHESDHVFGLAYNVLCGGTCLQDIEHRRRARRLLKLRLKRSRGESECRSWRADGSRPQFYLKQGRPRGS
jgi:hypothetical protein